MCLEVQVCATAGRKHTFHAPVYYFIGVGAARGTSFNESINKSMESVLSASKWVKPMYAQCSGGMFVSIISTEEKSDFVCNTLAAMVCCSPPW